MPIPLVALAEERANILNYRNVGRYFVGMALADIMQSGWLKRMTNIANSDPDVQDFLVEQILKLPIEQAALTKFLKGLLPQNGNKPKIRRKIAKLKELTKP